MKLLYFNCDVNRIICRFYGHGRLLKLKRMRDNSYTPWKSAEAVDSVEETLKTPYQQIIPSSKVKRVSETNPANHTYQDIGKFYVIPAEDKKYYFQLGGFPKNYNILSQTFNENALMIRKPAIEIIEYLKTANYEKLPLKIVLHGEIGCGKRLTKLHVLHYAFLNGFVVMDFPAVSWMFKYGRKETHFSEKRPPFIDLPLEGAVLLKHFQLQNGSLIDDLKLKTTKEYVWNLRESTPAGVPLMTLVKHGINRVTYACDCIDSIIQELKLAATDGKIKLLVSVDGFNAFFSESSRLKIDGKTNIDPRRTTIYQSLIRFLEPNWCNGSILATVSENNTVKELRGSPFPFFLLKREGFELFDPFLPVEVPKLSELEFHSLLDYYEDRRWLQKLGAREELEFLTCRVPYQIADYCASL